MGTIAAPSVGGGIPVVILLMFGPLIVSSFIGIAVSAIAI
jgi:hypothetical protein